MSPEYKLVVITAVSRMLSFDIESLQDDNTGVVFLETGVGQYGEKRKMVAGSARTAFVVAYKEDAAKDMERNFWLVEAADLPLFPWREKDVKKPNLEKGSRNVWKFKSTVGDKPDLYPLQEEQLFMTSKNVSDIQCEAIFLIHRIPESAPAKPS